MRSTHRKTTIGITSTSQTLKISFAIANGWHGTYTDVAVVLTLNVKQGYTTNSLNWSLLVSQVYVIFFKKIPSS